eukprot:3384495-Prymnesium_polylepis.3
MPISECCCSDQEVIAHSPTGTLSYPPVGQLIPSHDLTPCYPPPLSAVYSIPPAHRPPTIHRPLTVSSPLIIAPRALARVGKDREGA